MRRALFFFGSLRSEFIREKSLLRSKLVETTEHLVDVDFVLVQPQAEAQAVAARVGQNA